MEENGHSNRSLQTSEGMSQQSRFHDYSHDQLDLCLQVNHRVKGMLTSVVGECGRLVGNKGNKHPSNVGPHHAA